MHPEALCDLEDDGPLGTARSTLASHAVVSILLS